MNKEQFIRQLHASLKRLPEEDRKDIIQDYEEYFTIGLAEGQTEEQISAGLGSPSQIAKELMASYHLEKVEETASAGNIMRAVWAVIGLGFFNLVIVLGPFVALVGIIIAGWAVSIGFILSPIGALINVALGSFSLFDFFMSLALCGLGIFVGMGMFVATKGIGKGFIRYLKYNAALVKGGMKHE